METNLPQLLLNPATIQHLEAEAKQSAEKIFPPARLTKIELAVQGVEERGVHTQDELNHANDLVHQITDAKEQWVSTWKSFKDMANALHKGICALANPPAELLDKLRKRVERPMATYLEEQRRIREAQEKELEKLHQQALRQANLTADELLSQGLVKEAKAISAHAAVMPAPVLPAFDAGLDGTHERTELEVQITDIKALMQAALAGKVPMSLPLKDRRRGAVKGSLVDTALFEVSEGVCREAFRRAGKDPGWPGVVVKEKIGFTVKG